MNKNSAAEDTPVADWDLTFSLNTRGVFLCCQAQARHMLARGTGKIINTASMASLLVPHPQKQAAYNCSKAAVVKMTQVGGTVGRSVSCGHGVLSFHGPGSWNSTICPPSRSLSLTLRLLSPSPSSPWPASGLVEV